MYTDEWTHVRVCANTAIGNNTSDNVEALVSTTSGLSESTEQFGRALSRPYCLAFRANRCLLSFVSLIAHNRPYRR